MDPMITLEEAIKMIRSRASPDRLSGMARYGMCVEDRLGLSVPEMRLIARQIGRNHALAIALWQTGLAEARMIASMIADPACVTDELMEAWVKDFNSWDVCDQVCMNLFEKTPHAWRKIYEWAQRDEEYVKRAAYALLACVAWHDKTAANERFIQALPVISAGANDSRNYVKKAVNWALRNIGKRNPGLNQAAIQTARQLAQSESRAARWIAVDALRELESASVQARFQK
jgi:3-methyladenine DNA glycosylase AlkD